MRLFRLPVIIIVLMFLLVTMLPLSAGPPLSFSVGAQVTILSLGVAADFGIGPLHLGASARYHRDSVFAGFPYQEVMVSGYFTTEMLDTQRLNLQAGLGATSWLDFEYEQAAVLLGGQLRGSLKLKDTNSALVAEVLVPLQWFTWERNPPAGTDPDPITSSVGIMCVALLFEAVTVGWFWYF